MSKLFAALRRAPKRTAALMAIFAGVILVPATMFAWGPDRPTYTMAHPADHVTFNSITDNPAVGDERNFVRIKEAGASKWQDSATVQPGKHYSVMVYYHNNAATYLNKSGKGVAKNVMMRVQMPSSVAAGQSTNVDGVISASNASPKSVWDDSKIVNNTSASIGLSYVPNSAVIHNNGKSNGSHLPNALYGNGTPLGFDALNGTLPGCTEYSGYVTFDIDTAQPNFSVNKTVREDGTGKYVKSLDTTPGKTLDYEIEYNNTGSTTQKNVVIQDKLPAGVTYVPGSTQYASPTTGGKWVDQSSNDVVTNGISIGDYGPSSNAYVKFKAKVATNDKLPECGTNKLVNTATAKTDNGDKSSTATVTVNKECKPTPPQPVYTCDALAVDKISDSQFKFSTAYTVKNATVKKVVYVVKDQNGKEIYHDTNATYTQTTPGTYTVQSYVTVSVNGSTKTVTSKGCTAEFTVPKPPVNKVEACNTKTGVIEWVAKGQENTPPHTTDMSKCQPTPTPPTQPTPPELPHTGASDVVMSLVGAGSLIAALSYYVASRRAL